MAAPGATTCGLNGCRPSDLHSAWRLGLSSRSSTSTPPQNEPNANGVGDILLEFMGMLGKTEKFEHSAALEVTVPSANDALARLSVIGGEGEMVIRPAWGFT